MSFKKVDPKQSFPKMEEEILKFWEENRIFEKSVAKNPEEKSFVFFEGPPTANGKPGLHHVLARAFKDIIPRYKTMKGFRVERKAGWDTHGLPVELQVEKALGLKNKQDIENIVPGNPRESIIEFNKKCKESVWEYKDLWEKLTKRMAYWVDMEHPYITYDNKFVESVWWVIAQIYNTKNAKGESLIYKGHKVVPYCYRCGTTLSSHEVAQGYQTVKDNSVYVKFKAVPNKEKGIDENTYFLAWTTTPWTLPGNVALAVNKDIEYVKIEADPLLIGGKLTTDEKLVEESFYSKGTYILAKDIFWRNMGSAAGFQDVRELIVGDPEQIEKDILANIGFDEFTKKYKVGVLKGYSLINLEYEPLYETNDSGKKAHYVVAGDFVSTTDGTGIVHIAPAFGEDDARVGKENDLPTLLTVDTEGKITADVPGKGIPVKKKNEKNKYAVDELILEDLKKRNLLLKEKMYEHEYPFCWRCDTPLIYYAKPSWFIRMSELVPELVKNNENINWIPENIKEGRFGEWLRGAKDWAISRERYWGTPLPIWICEKCGAIKVVSSIQEAEELSGTKIADVHKPFIDDVKFKCSCGGEMKRVPEVLDVWFDSGSMPLAQFNYPNSATKEDKEKIESGKFFPADFISEAVDQTRGWFYTLHAIATILNKSGKVPTGYAYKNVICLGLILDAKGKKMSKSRGNIVEPMAIMDEYGADMLRWMLYTINQPGLPKKFDIKGMKDIMNRVFRMLWNSYLFFAMYAIIDKWEPKKKSALSENILDKWIISELNVLIKNVDVKLESYDVYNAAGMIEKFVDNLSNWYIRRSRKRFWKSEDDNDKENAYQTLHTVLVELSKLMAPFTPFIAEEIYKNLTNEESVHLADFPVADESLMNEKLNEEMNQTRVIITEALQLRAKAGIRVRQPLAELRITNYELRKEFADIIKEEVNVKDVVIKKGAEQKIELNTEITEELKLEGFAREIIRFVQEMRKEAGYDVDNRIRIWHIGMPGVFGAFGEIIAKETLANSINEGSGESADLVKEFAIENETVKISIKR